MKKVHFYFLISFCILSGCSWREYFIVSNNSAKGIVLSYEIMPSSTNFVLFNDVCRTMAVVKGNKFDWGNRSQASDLDSTFSRIEIKIPPRTAVVFGELANDHFESHDQDFINGRVFNLIKMDIVKENETLQIQPSTLKKFLTKVDGNHVIFVK